MISLITFSYWLTAAPLKSAFLGLKISTLLTSVYDIRHSYYTISAKYIYHKLKHQNAFVIHGIILVLVKYLVFFPLFVHPSPHTSYLNWSPAYFFFLLQNGNAEAEELVFSHYVICNDTHETLRFGQVDTDENVLLASLHSHQYSWRSHKSPQVKRTHTHTHLYNPGTPKYLMALSPVVFVGPLTRFLYICTLLYTQATVTHLYLLRYTNHH